MNCKNRILSLLFCLFFSQADAGGVFLYEIGSQDVGFASAGWSARAEDPSTAFTNPAGMSRLSCREVEFGVQPIYEHVHFDPASGTNVSGKKGDADQWLPAAGSFYVEPINDRWTAGVSIVGYFGSNLTFFPKYKDTWHGAFGARYRYSCELSFMGGIAYDSSAVNTANRPLDFPIGKQWRYSCGFEWCKNDLMKMGLQYTLQSQGNLFADVNRGPLAGHVVGKFKNVTGHFINLNYQMVF